MQLMMSGPHLFILPEPSETGEALTHHVGSLLEALGRFSGCTPSLPCPLTALWYRLTCLTTVLGSPGELGQLSRLTLTYAIRTLVRGRGGQDGENAV